MSRIWLITGASRGFGKEFVRASLFTTTQTSVVDMSPEAEDQTWLEELREGLDEPGQ